MKRKKQLFGALLAFVLLVSNLPFIANTVKADDGISVMLDGEQMVFDVAPQMINDRLMLPFRPLGEALGASADWDNEAKKIIMIHEKTYLELTIGSDVMLKGTASRDSAGTLIKSVTGEVKLDTPATIIQDRGMVPLRAVADGLGVTINWDGTTRTCSITSNKPKPTPTLPPTPVPVPVDPAFADTDHYQEVSGRRAQDMYGFKNAFALVVYNSQDSNSKDKFSIIKEAAAQAKYRIYGVDIDTKQFTQQQTQYLSFVWDHINKDSAAYPVVFFVYDDGFVKFIENPSSKDELVLAIENLSNNKKATPTPSPSPSPSPSPTPTAGSTAEGYGTGYEWTTADIYDISSRYDNREKFFLVVYDNSAIDINNNDSINALKNAFSATNQKVYVLDLQSNGYFYNSEIAQSIGYNITSPTVFFLVEKNVREVYGYPTDVENIKNNILNFNKQYYNYNY